MNTNLHGVILMMDQILKEIENGFVACEYCGDQEATRDLDFVGDLRAVKSELTKMVGEYSNKMSLTSGVWFQSSASGLWYQNPVAAGSVRVVLVNGRSYFNDSA